MKYGLYVVSKVKHAAMWKDFRAKGVPIVSSWIDDGEEKDIDFSEAWPRYLREVSHAANVLVYLEPGDMLKGGLAEVGAGLLSDAGVVIVGDPTAQFRTLMNHPHVYLSPCLQEIMNVFNSTLKTPYSAKLYTRKP